MTDDYVELENRALEEEAQAEAGHDAARTTDHPDYARLDEAQYYLGMERERDGDVSSARRSYFMLISQRPASLFVPLAYLAFADLFFDEATKDPSKWELAAQAYMKVIAYGPPQNRAFGYAWYRLAQVRWSQGDEAAAEQSFTKASAYAAAYPALSGSPELARAVSAGRAVLHGVSTRRPDDSCPGH